MNLKHGVECDGDGVPIPYTPAEVEALTASALQKIKKGMPGFMTYDEAIVMLAHRRRHVDESDHQAFAE